MTQFTPPSTFPPPSNPTHKHLVETLELKNANKLLESELKLARQENELKLTKQSLESKLAFQALTHDHKDGKHTNALRQKDARISELEAMLQQQSSQQSDSPQAKLSEHGEAAAKQRQGKEKFESPSQRPNHPRGIAEVRRQERPTLSGLGFPHLLAIVLEMVGGRTLLLDVPLVCKEWKATCRKEVVPAVMDFTQLGMRAISDYGLVVMLQRFPAASKIDISGKNPVPDSPSFHLNQHNNCVNTVSRFVPILGCDNLNNICAALSAIATASKKLTSLVIGEVGGEISEFVDFDMDTVAEFEGRKCKGPFVPDYKHAGLPLLGSLHVKDWHHTQMIPVARILSFFAQCPQLISVSVTNCAGTEEDVLLQLTDTLRSPFCAQLQTIHFGDNADELDGTYCEVGDAFMAQIESNCPNLTSLNVHCNSERLTNVGLQRLSRCKKLSVLKLDADDDPSAEQAVTDAGISQLAACRELTSVILRRFSRFTDDGISQFTKQLPKLTSLELQLCSLLKGVLTITLPQLKSFSLRQIHNNPASLSASEMCPNLTSLLVCSYSGFADARWNFKVLRKLVLKSSKATDGILTAVGDGCPLLESLVVEGTSSATVTGQTTAYFRNLVSLKMKNVPKVTSRDLASLVSRCPKLTKLVVKPMLLAPEDKNKIVADRPLLQIISEYRWEQMSLEMHSDY
jgi:hypothetical protein